MRMIPWICVLVASAPALAWGQDRGEEPRPSTSAFFGRKLRVSFWREEPKTEAPEQIPGQVESLWAEPIRLPDGRMTTYVPPRQVLSFLENPTEEAALAYLAWQKERMSKIARASEILSKIADRQRTEAAASAEKAPPAAEPSEPPRREQAALPIPAKTGPGTEEILYFKKEGCPHCRHEDEEISALKVERPAVKVRTLVPGEEDALWKAFGVEVVPTMILLRADGTRTVARGYTPKAALVAGLTQTNQGDKR